MLVQIISQTKNFDKNAGHRSCGFSFGDTRCGDPAVADIGGMPVCLEHLEYASSLSPGYDYRLIVGGRRIMIDRDHFLYAARKEDQNVRS